MAWASGTCTDFIDFLRKWRDYAAGTVNPATDPEITAGIQVPSGQRWTILSNGGAMPALPSSGSATDGEMYLQGPGSAGLDQIIVGFKTYRNASNNVYGFSISGATAFDATLTYSTLPGVQPVPAHVALANSSFNCWFWVNGSRMMAAARIGTTDVLMYAGFLTTFATRNQYPYPLFVGGSTKDATIGYQINSLSQSCIPDPCDDASSFRWVDGTWNVVQHYLNGGPFTTPYAIWPLRDASATDGTEVVSTDNEDGLWGNWSSTGVQISSSEIGAYALFPTILLAANQLVGQLTGVYVVNGLVLAAGDTITDPNSNVYDVFHNTWRSAGNNFIAVLRA
jgi:hypothetical protein